MRRCECASDPKCMCCPVTSTASAQIVGKVLMVDAIDGQYFCSEARRGASCVQILTADGKVDRRSVKQQHRDGLKFSPADQPGKECRVKRGGEVDCAERLKRSDLRAPLAKLALYQWADEDDDPPSANEEWEGQSLDTITIWGSTDAPLNDGWWYWEIAAPAPLPRYDQCQNDCNDRDRRFGNMYRISAALPLLLGGTPAQQATRAALVFLVCEAARGVADEKCCKDCVI